jgi:hypothetical protein
VVRRKVHRRGAWGHWKRSNLQCRTNVASSNRAGVIRSRLSSGYTMVGGGIYNKYRHFNRLSAFEESYPEGNNWRCDTGFGPGRLNCYSRMCKLSGMSCTTRAAYKNGHGIAIATLPHGYIATGGGVYNHYRHFNKHSAFETSMPHGHRQWRCDMGLGYGRFHCYVRGCKASSSKRLRCITKQSNVGNWHNVQCPRGWRVTGCGQNEVRRQWNKYSGFEEWRVHGNGCVCDSGFGPGRNRCYTRCCQMQTRSKARRPSKSFNDQVSSIKSVQKRCMVTLYKHCNYRGHAVRLYPGRYTMHTLMRRYRMKNDDISSIKVSKGCAAHLYQHWNFRGARMTKRGNDSCFTNDIMYRRTICRNHCRHHCRSHKICHKRRVSYRGLHRYTNRMRHVRNRMNHYKRRIAWNKVRAKNLARKHHKKKAVNYSGRGWCETFHSCKRGDGRNFWAWRKNQGYKMYKGACAHSNGKYGKRHKYWPGKFSYAQCKAKCDRMGGRCQGITMPANIKKKMVAPATLVDEAEAPTLSLPQKQQTILQQAMEARRYARRARRYRRRAPRRHKRSYIRRHLRAPCMKRVCRTFVVCGKKKRGKRVGGNWRERYLKKKAKRRAHLARLHRIRRIRERKGKNARRIAAAKKRERAAKRRSAELRGKEQRAKRKERADKARKRRARAERDSKRARERRGKEQRAKRVARERSAKVRAAQARERRTKTIRRNNERRAKHHHRIRRNNERRAKHHHRIRVNRERAAKRRAAASRKSCSGRSWCETFYSCKRGDRRNFHAFVKNQGYRMHKGACAHGNGRYGRRHRFWGGRYTFGQCRAKCDRMGGRCQGITMTTAVRCNARRAPRRAARYHGRGWCETFYSCKRGDGRNFWAWVKNQGYRMHKGACAHSNGRYGRRHKFWGGRFTFGQCKAKCDRMGGRCQGITMPKNIRRRL